MKHACNSSTQEVQAGGPDVQGYPQLKREFKSILDDSRACLKISNKQTNKKKKHFTTTKNKDEGAEIRKLSTMFGHFIVFFCY